MKGSKVGFLLSHDVTGVEATSNFGGFSARKPASAVADALRLRRATRSVAT